MHIVFISPVPWVVPARDALARQHRLTHMQGTLADVQDRVTQARPDLVLLRDMVQSDALVAHIDSLCSALPGMALVLLCSDPAPLFLMEVMRAGVREVMPSDDEASLTGLIVRIQGRQLGRSPTAQGRCLGIVSAKGGDGGSCVAANLAAAVAGLGTQRVLLMDLSPPFGDLELFAMGEPVTHDLAAVSEEIERLDGSLLEGLTQHVSPHLHFIGAPPTLEKYLRLQSEHVQRLIRLAQRHYDLVMLDLGLDAIGLGTLDMLDQLVVVACATLPSVKGAAHRVALWEQMGLAADKLCLVMRRPGTRHDISQADVESAVGRRVARLIPHDDDAVALSLAQGRAVVSVKPRSALSQSFAAWAADLTGSTPQAPAGKSLWHRLRNR